MNTQINWYNCTFLFLMLLQWNVWRMEDNVYYVINLFFDIFAISNWSECFSQNGKKKILLRSSILKTRSTGWSNRSKIESSLNKCFRLCIYICNAISQVCWKEQEMIREMEERERGGCTYFHYSVSNKIPIKDNT